MAGSDLGRPLSSFVGREVEIGAVSSFLRQRRLVTIVGPGGCGKTRVALEVATARPSVRIADLASVDDDAALAVARAVNAVQAPHESALGASIRALGDGEWLLLVDNCEHVIDDAAAVIDAILHGCPSVAVLATSRSPLGVDGEQVLPLGPLPIDDAVRLFVDRARRAAPSFEVNELEVRELCARVDGLPLAIELAAARVAALSVADIVAGVEEGAGLLSSRWGPVGDRHVSVEASIEWSYRLLSDPEQAVLRALSVLRSAFSLEAARSVIGPAAPDGAAVRVVAALVDKSLLVVEPAAGGVRYRLLETVRDFALARLRAAGDEETAARVRHLEFLVGLAERMESDLDGPALFESIAEVRAFLPDMRAAIAWAAEQGRAEESLRMVGALWRFWWAGARGEGVEAVEQALAIPGGDDRHRAKALVAATLAAGARFDLATAVSYGEQATAVAAMSADDATMAHAHCWLGWMLAVLDPAKALPHLAQATDLARVVGDVTVLGDARNAAAAAWLSRGDVSEGVAALDEVLALTTASGNRITRAHALATQVMVHVSAGALGKAARAADEALATTLPTGDAMYSVSLLVGAAWLAALRGDEAAALDAAAQAEATAAASANELLIATGAAAAGIVAFSAGRTKAAIPLLDASVGSLSILSAPLGVEVQRMLALSLLATGDPAGARAVADGAAALADRSAQPWARSRAKLADARVLLAAGEVTAAATSAQAAADVAVTAGDEPTMVDFLECLAAIDWARQRPAAANRSAAAAASARTRLGYRQLQSAPVPAGDDDRSWNEGFGMSLATAAAKARRGLGSRARPTSGWDSLTPAERDVVELVAAGLTNPRIAERLVVSRETVKGHVAVALRKLGVSNRTELAALTARRRAASR